MPNTVDSLGIQINASARSAYSSIEKLSQQLSGLSAVLQSVDTSKLTVLNDNLRNLGTSMQFLWQNTKTADFTRVKTALDKITTIDAGKVLNTSESINELSRSFSSLGVTAQGSADIAQMATSLAKLGSKSVQNATTNLPHLADALRQVLATLATAPSVNRNIIDMTNALANLASQGRGMGAATRTMITGLTHANSGMAKSTRHVKSLASAFGRLYASFFLVIRGVRAFYQSIQDTSDYLEAFNYFDVTFGKIANEWSSQFENYGYKNAEAYASSFVEKLNQTLGKMSGLKLDEASNLIVASGIKNLGMSLTELTQYASSIASITNAIGATGEVSVATAKSVTMLAADLGSLKNLDFEQVSQNIQSALTGQARALYKYGIDVTNATLETYAATLGIQKNVSEMTQSEKMQLRLLAILDQSKVAWGDLANTINSPSNMIRQFKNNLKECGTVLGQLFIPLLERTLPVINGVTIAIKRMLVSLAELLGIELDLSEFGEGYSEALSELNEDLDQTADSANNAKKGIRAFDKLNVIASGSTKTKGMTQTLDLTEEITKATQNYEKVWNEAYDKMANKAQEFADRIEEALSPLKQIFDDLVLGDYFKVGQDVSGLVRSIEDFFDNAIRSVDWYKVGVKIGDFLKGIDWIEILKGLGNIVGDAINAALQLYTGIFDAAPIETALLTGIALLKWTSLGEVLGKSIQKATTSSKFIQDLEFWSQLSTTKWMLKGAISLSAGALLTIENVSAVAKGTYDATSAQSVIKGVISSALMGVGTGILVNWASKGAIALGAACTVTIPIAIIATIASLTIAQSNRNTKQHEQNILESSVFSDLLNEIDYVTEQSELAVQKWQTTRDTLSNGIADIEYNGDALQRMADDYYNLSQRYDTLTDSEKGLLQYYAETLGQKVPEITGQINKITNAYTGTYQELEKIIEKEQSRLKYQAYSESIIEGYKNEAQIKKEIEEGNKIYTTAEQAYASSNKKFYDAARSSYEHYKNMGGQNTVHSGKQLLTLSEYIDVVTKAFESGSTYQVDYTQDMKDAWLVMDQGKSSLDTIKGNLDDLSQSLKDNQNTIKEWYDELGKAYSGMSDTIIGEGDAIGKAIVDASKLSSEDKKSINTNAKNTGKNYGNNVKKGIIAKQVDIASSILEASKLSENDQKDIEEMGKTSGGYLIDGLIEGIKAKRQEAIDEIDSTARAMNETIRNVDKIASPSKLYKKYGQYIVEGLTIGIEKNSDEPVTAIGSLAEAMNKRFDTSNLAMNIPSVSSVSDSGYLGSSKQRYSESNSVLNSLAQSLSGSISGGNTQVTFQVEGDPNGIFKVVQKEARNFSNRTGTMAFV